MTSRIIVTGKNSTFSVFGMPAPPGGARRRAEGSSAPSRQELPAHSGVQPASGPSAELMDTKTAKSTPTTTPEAAPAVSGTRLFCRSCGGCGWNYNDYICSLSKNWTREQVTCGRCGGDGYDEVAA